MFDPNDAEMAQAAQNCPDDLLRLTLDLNGSVSGEHGIGIVKRDLIGAQIPPATMEMMRGIKRLFDPGQILNADKQLPPA